MNGIDTPPSATFDELLPIWTELSLAALQAPNAKKCCVGALGDRPILPYANAWHDQHVYQRMVDVNGEIPALLEIPKPSRFLERSLDFSRSDAIAEKAVQRRL